jgi:hypothetical protein
MVLLVAGSGRWLKVWLKAAQIEEEVIVYAIDGSCPSRRSAECGERREDFQACGALDRCACPGLSRRQGDTPPGWARPRTQLLSISRWQQLPRQAGGNRCGCPYNMRRKSMRQDQEWRERALQQGETSLRGSGTCHPAVGCNRC